jgi:two-component system sensor histidine kinase QseC
MTSIRGVLTASLFRTLGLIMIGGGVLLYGGIRRALTSQFDETLRGRLTTLMAATRWDGTHLDIDFTGEAMPWYQPGLQAEYFELISAAKSDRPTGQRSPSLGGREWTHRPAAGSSYVDDVLPDGRRGRIVSSTFRPLPDEELDAVGREQERVNAVASSPEVNLTVAMGRESLDSALNSIAGAFLAGGVVVCIALVVGIRAAVRRGLAPLATISAQVEKIDARTLATRVETRGTPEELAPILDRLNQLIARLEEAFSRERRFASAAAHELRTPVAELRTLLEVSLSRDRCAEEYRIAMSEALSISLRAEGLVRTLLTLARRDNPVANTETAVADVLEEVATRHEQSAAEHGGEIICVCSDRTLAGIDGDALRCILDNVIANAVEYASPLPRVRCEVHSDDRRVSVTVTNPADGVYESDVARFFEPFWRKSASRTDRGHLGLGLSVAKELAERGNGTMTAVASDGCVVVTLSLPKSHGREHAAGAESGAVAQMRSTD